MNTIKLGILREGKIPPDKRVPFTPLQAEEIEQRYPHVKVIVQPSTVRCFEDSEYAKLDLEVRENLQDCDILMGIKEVQIPDLIPGKNILIFFRTPLKSSPTTRSYSRK
jgi:saccharopine dehydrogenase (NAD+, L-lysine-forming)